MRREKMTTHNIKITIAASILLFVCIGVVSGTTITAQGGTIPSPGSTGEFPIIVDSLPNGLSGFVMTVTLSDPLKAEITEAITPPWADISLIGGTLASGPDQHVSVMAGSVDLSIATFEENFKPSGNLTLVTLEIQGVAQGSTGLQITNVDIEDMDGNPIAASVQNGTIVIGSVTPTVSPTPTETVSPTPTETVSPTPTETVSPTPTETVSPTPTETVSPTPTETESPIVTPTETGSIDVQSTPGGGNVYLEGNLVGVTPVVVADLSPGLYTVLIQKDGYDTFENTSVIVSAGNTTQVYAVLEQTPSSSDTTGSLDITSIPSNAEVYLDDAYKGRTPLLIVNLDPGAYMLRIEKEGYNSWYQGITIVAGKTIFITAPLTPIPTTIPTTTPTPTQVSVGMGGLYVVSEPTATVFVDGIERGKSNEVIDKVPAGIWNMTLFKAGFVPKSVMVTIGINRVTVTAKIVLEPGAGPTTQTTIPTTQPTSTSTPTTQPTVTPGNPGPYPPLPTTGGVFVYTVPFGCSVYIDDIYKGSSPNLFTSIQPGNHFVKLALTGYQDSVRPITVNAGDITMVTAMMIPDFSALVSAFS
jgi:hypothetical protein